MSPLPEMQQLLPRRLFFGRAGIGLGSLALASLMEPKLFSDDSPQTAPSAGQDGSEAAGGLPGFPNFTARANRVIYLLQSGAPSQMDLFDSNPNLPALRGTGLPVPVGT